MTDKKQDGGPAFPGKGHPLIMMDKEDGTVRVMPGSEVDFSGMLLRAFFAAHALVNPVLCTGSAAQYQIKAWFGDRGGVTQQEIAAKQAVCFADAPIVELSKPGGK